MFEKATRMKLRFNTPSGKLSVEDLWDIALDGQLSLNAIAKDVNRQIKAMEEESFVDTPKRGAMELNLKMDILKHVIAVRIAERDEAKEAKAKADMRQKVLETIAKKESESLEGMSIEELKKML